MIAAPPYKQVISILSKLTTAGNEPLVVLADGYETYYVKNSQLRIPAYDMINEVICHFLFAAWRIKTPEIAFMRIAEDFESEFLQGKHKHTFYNRLGFGSKSLDKFYDINEFVEAVGKVAFRKFNNPMDFIRIGLFDMWVENDDRPPHKIRNVLINSESEMQDFVPIDNAFAFRTGAYDTLADPTYYPAAGAYIIESPLCRQLIEHVKTKDWLKREQENFYLCIRDSEKIFPYISKIIPEDWGYTKEIADLIGGFIFNSDRNEALLEDYLRYY